MYVHVGQACHLDILMKTQGEKTKTQEQKTQNSRAKNQKLKDSLKTLKILGNLSILCSNFHSKGTFKYKVFPNSQYFLIIMQKLKNFLKTLKILKNLNILCANFH